VKSEGKETDFAGRPKPFPQGGFRVHPGIDTGRWCGSGRRGMRRGSPHFTGQEFAAEWGRPNRRPVRADWGAGGEPFPAVGRRRRKGDQAGREGTRNRSEHRRRGGGGDPASQPMGRQALRAAHLRAARQPIPDGRLRPPLREQ
jgi:hypothetical protein